MGRSAMVEVLDGVVLEAPVGAEVVRSAQALISAAAAGLIDPEDAGRVTDGLLSMIEGLERSLNAISAQRLALIGVLAAVVDAAPQVMVPLAPGERATGAIAECAHRGLVADLALATGASPWTAAGVIGTARESLTHAPGLLRAMAGGRISQRHLEQVLRHTSDLSTPVRAELETAVLAALASNPTPAALGRVARRARERLHPEPLAARHATASRARSVEIEPAADGMAWLTAFLPAVQAHAIHDKLTTIAHRLAQERDPDPSSVHEEAGSGGEREMRTLAQRRADVLTSLILDMIPPHEMGMNTAPAPFDSPASPAWTVPPGLRGIRPIVAVTVPVMTLLGTSDEPGHLDGYGPIDPGTARALAAHAPSFIRLLTHPETGAILSVGRTRYAVPAELRTWLRLRDETCRFPGCPQTAARSDLDHTIAFRENGATGHTAADNLVHLCRTHHRLKHTTRWTTTQHADATLTWTSPTGRSHTTKPRHAPPTQSPQMRSPQMRPGCPPGSQPPTPDTPAPDDAALTRTARHYG